MKNTIHITLIILFVCFFYNQPLKAQTYFIDFKFILNESSAGKKANQILNSELKQGIKKLKESEKKLQLEEKEIIQQKKVLSPEDYKGKITQLRKKVSNLQKDRNTILESISKKRSNARKQLLESLNPIVKNYMTENNIKIVLDKKSILLADDSLNITDNIMSILNKQLKSINLK